MSTPVTRKSSLTSSTATNNTWPKSSQSQQTTAIQSKKLLSSTTPSNDKSTRLKERMAHANAVNKTRKVSHEVRTQTNYKRLSLGVFLILAGLGLMSYHVAELAGRVPTVDFNSAFAQLSIGGATGIGIGAGALTIKQSLKERAIDHVQKPSTGRYALQLLATIISVAALIFASLLFCQGPHVDFGLFSCDSTILNLSIGTLSGLIILNAVRLSLNFYRDRKRAGKEVIAKTKTEKPPLDYGDRSQKILDNAAKTSGHRGAFGGDGFED